MFEPNLYSISIFQIQMFLAAAEQESFTKAAEKMNITQPVMSKNIAAMEDALNLQLFVRANRSVRLTEAGKLMYEHMSGLLPTLEQVVTKAHLIQSGASGHISIGLHNAYDGRLIVPLINEFARQYPHITIQIKSNTMQDLRKRLLSGEVDVSFTTKFEGDDIIKNNSTQYRAAIVLRFPLQAIVLQSSPLAQRDMITVADLRNMQFIVHSPVLLPTYNRLIRDTCAQYGFVPQEYAYIEDANCFQMSLRDDNHVIIADRALRDDPGVPTKRFDLPGTDSGISMMWRAEYSNPAIAKFIDLSLRYFSEHPDL